MTPKDIYIMGRAEYLTDHEGYSLTEACKIAEKEWDKSKEGEGLDDIHTAHIDQLITELRKLNK